jgi:stress response protein YsnF
MIDRESQRRAPGANPARGTPPPAGAQPLALDARVERAVDGGWRVTIPLRAERVRADRQTVVRQEVVLRPRMVSGVERVDGSVAREELRVDAQGDLEATQPIADR